MNIFNKFEHFQYNIQNIFQYSKNDYFITSASTHHCEADKLNRIQASDSEDEISEEEESIDGEEESIDGEEVLEIVDREEESLREFNQWASNRA